MEHTTLRQFNPSGKLFLNLLFLLAALFSSSYFTSLALLLLLSAAGICLRGFRVTHLKLLFPFMLFAFSLVWMNGIWGYTDPDQHSLLLLGIEFSPAGLSLGTLLALRVIIIILSGVLFTLSSPPQDLILSLMQQLAFPSAFAYSTLAILNLMSEIRRDRSFLNASYTMRTGRKPNALRSLIPLLAINIRRCEHISLAMEAKGFTMKGKRTFYREVPWRARDTWFIIVMSALVAGVFFLTVRQGYPVGYARWEGYQ